MLFPVNVIGQYVEPTLYSANCTSGSGSFVKGSWTQLIPAIPHDACGLFFNQDWVDVTSSDMWHFAVEIAIGGVGSETIVIPSIPGVMSGRIPRGHHTATFFPISIKKNSRIIGRGQHASSTATAIWIAVQPIYGSSPPIGRHITSIGFDATAARGVNVVSGGSALAWGSWTEIASGGFQFSTVGIIPTATRQSGENAINQHMISDVQIGIGAAGSETIVGSWVWGSLSQSGTRTGSMIEPQKPFRAYRIPAGVRVAARHRSNYASANLRVTIHGVH